MGLAEVVRGDKEANRVRVVFSLTRDAYAEPDEALIEVANGEVCAFDVAGADVGGIGIPRFNEGAHADARGWGIAANRVCRIPAVPAIKLLHNGVIEVFRNVATDGIGVRLPTVGCDLDRTSKALGDIGNKKVRADGIAGAGVMRQNQLCIGVNAQEGIKAADLAVRERTARLGRNELRPYLVNLKVLNPEIN